MIDEANTKCYGGLVNCFGRMPCWCLILCVSGIIVTFTAADPKEHLIPPEIANQPPDHRSAHRHTDAEHSCCAPCAPEANRDPDVFRRSCFVRALARARQGFHSHYAQTGTHGIEIKVSGDAIPVHSVQGFRALLNAVLRPDSLPQTWDEINFTVPYPMARTTELRGGVRMLVGQEVCRGPQPGTLKDGDPIQAGWTVRGIDVLPLTWHRKEESPRRAYIRLRLHGSERLELGQRPEDFTRSSKDFGAFFNRDAFHSLLSKVFRVPFESLDDFLVDGFDTEYEGVRVFHGQIRSRDRVTQLREDRSQKPLHWWDEMRLLVTDSDPQYFCIQIVMRERDR